MAHSPLHDPARPEAPTNTGLHINFLYGIAAFVLIIIFTMAGALTPGTFLLGPIMEELTKVQLARNAREGVAAGLGFGIMETAAYGGNNIIIWMLRSISTIPLHAGMTGMAAQGISQSRLLPLVVAIGIHASYNGILRLF